MPTRRFLVAVLTCSAFAWLSGPSGRFLVILPLLLFGPGYLLERALLKRTPHTPFLRPTLWLGLSLSIVALVYQWATALELTLTPAVLGVGSILCGLGVIWHVGTRQNDGMARQQDTELLPLRLYARTTPALAHPFTFTTGALLIIFILTLWTRFVQIQDLALPAWVDSVHHALMIRVAAEHGQAPYSLHPYLPVDNMPYHWGYHVFTAAVMQLSGVPLPQVMLWEGQVLNALLVLTCSALAAYLWQRPLAGVAAGLIVGLISIMPAYYVSWGRYTQLTGLLMLPALALAWHLMLRTRSRRWMLGAAILLAGLSIVHFRVLIFALGLLAPISIIWLCWQERPVSQLRGMFILVISSAIIAIALAAPWLQVIATRTLLPAVERPQDLVGGGDYNALKASLLWAGHNRLLIALALASAFWGLWQRSRVSVEQISWVGCLLVMANPWLLGYLLPAIGAITMIWSIQQRRFIVALCSSPLLLLNPLIMQIPYVKLITNEVVIISLFMPLSVLVGGGMCMLTQWLDQRFALARQPIPWLNASAIIFGSRQWAVVALVVLAFLGAWNQRKIINPVTVLATPADFAAVTWAVEHTPADARFLINATSWLRGSDRAVDGGWWLLPLAGRWVSTPPVLYIYGSPDYVREVQARSQTVVHFQAGQEQQIEDLIAREQITHIYLGPTPGPLSPETFADESRFTTMYSKDGVTILAVIHEP